MSKHKREDPPKNLWSLTWDQIDDFFVREFKKFEKDLEKIYREDLEGFGLAEHEAKRVAKERAGLQSSKLQKKYLRRQKKFLQGNLHHIRNHPDN